MKKLIICNTVYQVLVALWLKQTILSNDLADIIVSDHMVGGEDIAKRISSTNEFEKVYFVESRKMVKGSYSTKEKILYRINPKKILKRYIQLSSKYDEIYMANVDRFSRLIFHTIANGFLYRYRNKNAKVVLYEDGISTYSKMFGEWYFSCRLRRLPMYNPKAICGNASKLYVFDKDCVDWTPDMPIFEIPKINPCDEKFKNTVNYVFAIKEFEDSYDTKYLFMEESFLAENIEVEDVSFVDDLAEEVGKENIMVKIHPRNPINRFEKLGYKTNKNISIPWEVIILNQNMNDKILYTISSSAVLSPARLFGERPEVHLLYDKLEKVPDILSSGLLDITKKFFEKYYGC